jgi:RNA-splicing ligase RtcB
MGKGLARDNSDVVTDERDLVMRGMGGLKDNIIRLLKLTPDSYEFEQDLSSTPELWDAVPKRAMGGFGTLGSLGGGNHFIEFQSAEVLDPATAKAWGIEPDQLLIMIHSGSRKFGYEVAEHYMNGSRRQFVHRARAEDIRARLVHAARIERSRAERRDVPLSDFHSEIDDTAARILIRYTAPDGEVVTWNEEVPGSDLAPFFDPRFVDDSVGLPYALNPLPGAEIAGLPREAIELGQRYWLGVQASQNFAVLSRTIMLYRAAEELVRLFGHDRVQPRLLYDISHNNVQVEKVDGRPMFVHRKGATRAFPAGHEALAGTPWAATGHPITVPGSMGSYSYIMKALPTAEASLYSVNHGAGRAMSRGDARRTLDLSEQQAVLAALDNVVVGGTLDEMPAAYKDIDAVVETCRRGGLCQEVIRCVPALTIKGDDDGYD